ncbi:glucokinase [uncultured Muriicola sp.]|uniref:glucokinase n=1 Tax=uncultured Muriicola sp. TaxID=1583102 RepID=UPI0026261F39|nr:glucokinase [uncultured Muriicola sp.]
MIQNGDIFSLPLVHESLIPLAFLEGKINLGSKAIILAGDVGGTKSSLVLFQITNGQLTVLKEGIYPTRDHKSFVALALAFLGKKSTIIDGVCLGVAGPVNKGKVHGTNFPWKITVDEIRKGLRVKWVSLINDMEANAYGLAALQYKDLAVLKSGSDIAGNAAVISSGTGLGEAGLYWDGARYHPFATEGGHCDFGPRNELDIELWRSLHKKYGHVSWERVVSGPGICDIHDFLRRFRDQPESKGSFEDNLKEDRAKVITTAALEGRDSICVETLELYIRFLAAEAAQLALKTKATGGIYIGGGIVPKILKGIDKDVFRKNFIQSGRMNPLLEMVPVTVVLNENTALLGAAYYGAMSIDK